jgi:hypothetical protein
MFYFSFKNYFGATTASLVNILLRLVALAVGGLVFLLVGGVFGGIFEDIQVLKVIFIILGIVAGILVYGIIVSFIDKYTDKMATKTILKKLTTDKKFAIKYLKFKPDSRELVLQIYPDLEETVPAR